MTSKIRFAKANELDFYSTLNKRVDEYFFSNKISKNANWIMVFKAFFYLGVFTAAYLLLIIKKITVLLYNLLLWILWVSSLLLSVLTFLTMQFTVLCRGHKRVNKILSYTFNIIGANAYLWGIMHNIVHHTYTNIEGHDEDIESVPLLRICPHQKLLKIHRYQYWYAFLFYGFGFSHGFL